MFTKVYVAPNGASTNFHTVKRFEATLPTEFVTVHVQSFMSQEDALSGVGIPSWAQPMQMPKEAFAAQIEASMEQWLVSANASPFGGGSIVAVTNSDLVAEKIKQWAAVKGARDATITAGFDWNGSRFDSEVQSQIFINGACLLATLAMIGSQAFALDFTLQNNTVRSLTGADMLAVGQAMGAHVMTAHGTGRVLRAAIEAATTVAAVKAVKWPR